MRLILADTAPESVAVWKFQFLSRPEVEIRQEHVFDTAADAILLPGNSFGFLDSGLALEASERFGWDLQEELRRVIRADFSGELLVGQAVGLRLPSIPYWVVYAPTWRTPRKLENTLNVYLAVRGAFLVLAKWAGSPWPDSPGSHLGGSSLAVPMLGVKEGGLDPRVSARQIRYAYEVSTGQRGPGDRNLTQLMRRERKLLQVPKLGQNDDEDGGGQRPPG